MTEFRELIVHHSGGPRDQTVESIRDFHTRSKSKGGRGWSDIGYHWIVDGSAKLHVGRRIPTTGAHAPPNAGRLGLLVVGNNLEPGEAWTPGQIVLAREVVRSVRLLAPWVEVRGHFEVMRPGYTECPGLDIHALLGA